MTLAIKVTSILSTNNLAQLANKVDHYIYGHLGLTLDDNKEVFLSKIQYILG